MRYRFIGAEKANYPVTILCRVMQVSSSGYYMFAKRGPSVRALANQHLLAEIKEIHEQSRGTYGSPRNRLEHQERPTDPPPIWWRPAEAPECGAGRSSWEGNEGASARSSRLRQSL